MDQTGRQNTLYLHNTKTSMATKVNSLTVKTNDQLHFQTTVLGIQQEFEKHWSQCGLEPLNLWAFYMKCKKNDGGKKCRNSIKLQPITQKEYISCL